MKFEIPFDENIYRQQIELTFNISWEKFLREAKKTATVAVIFILLGILILYGKGDIGGLFIILGLVSAISSITGFNKYKEAKKTTERITVETIQKWHENPISVWEFESSYFRFEFYGGDYKINWDNFKYFNVANQTVFFGFKENTNWYSLSESEIGKENFTKVVDFVASKVKTSH